MAERGTHKPYVAGSNPAVGTIPHPSKNNFMPYHRQSANRLTERVHAVVRSVIARAELPTLLVACSGGADSTCLLHAVVTVTRQTGQRVIVCHVRHGVRADDARDAEAVRAIAVRLDVDCRVLSLPTVRADDGRSASENDLRSARYGVLAAIAADLHAAAVLTGHTLDDQAETVLLHLLRGTGVEGLGGMAEEVFLPLPRSVPDERGHQPLRIIRPLLSVRRVETAAYCAAHDLTAVHDPTNDDQRYTRNWLRHAILPALRERNPDIAAVLARAASTIRDDAALLSAQTALAMARCDCRAEQSCTSVSQAAFTSEHVALQRRILREIVQQITGSVPRAADVAAIQQYATTTHSSAMRHFGGVACCLVFDRVVLGTDHTVASWIQSAVSEQYPLAQCAEMLIPGMCMRLTASDHSAVHYDLRVIEAHRTERAAREANAVSTFLHLPEGATILMRNRLPMDRFWPSGSAKPRLLRDYLNARGIPAPVRDQLPLLVVNDTIAWVIGHEVSVAFAATEATATHIGILTRVTGKI